MSLGYGFRQTSLFAPTVVFSMAVLRWSVSRSLTRSLARSLARPSSTDPKSVGCLTERCHAVAGLLGVDGDGGRGDGGWGGMSGQVGK